jgi:cytochrome P450
MINITVTLFRQGRLLSEILGQYFCTLLPLLKYTALPLCRGILHDSNMYLEPHLFNPDRFIGGSDNQHLSPADPLSVAFGYGRRMCPGRHMAEAQVWITIACILSVFDISSVVDDNGCKIDVTPAFSSGMIS